MSFSPSSFFFLQKGGNFFFFFFFNWPYKIYPLTYEFQMGTGFVLTVKWSRIKHGVWGWGRGVLYHHSLALTLTKPFLFSLPCKTTFRSAHLPPLTCERAGDNSRIRKIKIKWLDKECFEQASKVYCLYDISTTDTSDVSNQFCRGAKAARHWQKPEQSDPWIHNIVSLTRLICTFKIALKSSSAFFFFSPLITAAVNCFKEWWGKYQIH